MDEETEHTRHMHLKPTLLGAFPYVLVQIEPTDTGNRLCVDYYDQLTKEDVIDILKEALEDVMIGQSWT